MSSLPYLVQLAQRLTDGLKYLPDDRRGRHRDFLLSKQNPDGGFSGREGGSDLYYSSFAVRALQILGTLTPDTAGRVLGYLRQFDWRTLGVIDLMNWLSLAAMVQLAGGEDLLKDEPADWPEQMAARLEALRMADGGYAKGTEGATSSTYHSFLVVLTYQLLGKSAPRPNALAQFIYDRQRDDGGFVEIGPMKRSGTNPTAAACALLHMQGRVDSELREDIAAFLVDVRTDESAFLANARIPIADGLSTFTAVLTAQDIEVNALVDPPILRLFVEKHLELSTGGFRAAEWDNMADVEYTFYGLGILGLLGAPTTLQERRSGHAD
jgi:geranylgeranyl transferase type-2 subunit beta